MSMDGNFVVLIHKQLLCPVQRCCGLGLEGVQGVEQNRYVAFA